MGVQVQLQSIRINRRTVYFNIKRTSYHTNSVFSQNLILIHNKQLLTFQHKICLLHRNIGFTAFESQMLKNIIKPKSD